MSVVARLLFSGLRGKGSTFAKHPVKRSVQGAIEPEPQTQPQAVSKVLLVTAGSLYVGGKLAQQAAAFLEENEIFVHEEDDDD
ncbi:Uncharacterized protein family UPF0466 [Aphelenchoides avenae]|nr:Uncharacterized protein family UPF0466 [Aphelenchus avenae]